MRVTGVASICEVRITAFACPLNVLEPKLDFFATCLKIETRFRRMQHERMRGDVKYLIAEQIARTYCPRKLSLHVLNTVI